MCSSKYKYVVTYYQGENTSKFFALSLTEYCKMDSLKSMEMDAQGPRTTGTV